MNITAQIIPNSLFSSEGLVVVISGGGTGIGLAFASALLQTGARKVFILGRRAKVLDKAAKELDPSGDVVVPLPCDVADVESVKQTVDKVRATVGYVDVLINNAGISGPNHKSIYDVENIEDLQSILLGQWTEWEQTLAINTASVLGVSAAFLKLLDAANARRGFSTGKVGKEGGRERQKVDGIDPDDVRAAQIITVSSIAGFNRHITAGFAYSSSKAGAISIGKALATLLAPWGIRSNVICPGLFPSDMTTNYENDHVFPYEAIPAHRFGNFNEIAGTLLYLIGKGGAYVNGTMQVVDGGRLSVMPATY